MASGLLMLRLTTDMLDTDPTDMESAPLMPKPTTDTPDTDPTDMARGLLMLRPTTDMPDMAPTPMASKCLLWMGRLQPIPGISSNFLPKDTSGINQNCTWKPKVQRPDMIREFCNLLNETKINLY